MHVPCSIDGALVRLQQPQSSTTPCLSRVLIPSLFSGSIFFLQDVILWIDVFQIIIHIYFILIGSPHCSQIWQFLLTGSQPISHLLSISPSMMDTMSIWLLVMLPLLSGCWLPLNQNSSNTCPNLAFSMVAATHCSSLGGGQCHSRNAGFNHHS